MKKSKKELISASSNDVSKKELISASSNDASKKESISASSNDSIKNKENFNDLVRLAEVITGNIIGRCRKNEQFNSIVLFKSIMVIGSDEIDVIKAMINIILYENDLKALYTLKCVSNNNKLVALTDFMKLN